MGEQCLDDGAKALKVSDLLAVAAPDDRRFLMIRPVAPSATDKTIVVENWFEELKAKARK